VSSQEDVEHDQPGREGEGEGSTIIAVKLETRIISSHELSEPFIQRPVATSLLMVGVLLMGLLGYYLLPISALPPVDFPTIQVVAHIPAQARM